MTNSIEDRCRLVLIAPEDARGADFEAALKAALSAGDVASVIFPAYGTDEAGYQRFLERCVPIAQEFGAAAIVVDDTRAFGRTGADGLHIDGGTEEVGSAVEKADGRYIVGAGRAETRHRALELGEKRPDYLFFGRFGQDTRPEPHRRNLALAEWWAAMVEIPCIVMGGAALETLNQAASTGAEFVALSRAVFGEGIDPAAAVAEANRILEGHTLAVEA